MSQIKSKAIEAINANGVLLVFPKKESPEIPSLWHCLHPRTKMVWEWDDKGDGRVFALWHLMKELSSERDVVYLKWFQDRATFFSKEVFLEYLSFLQTHFSIEEGLSAEAENLLAILRLNSPQSTRELKKEAGLQGKFYLSSYTRAIKQLFQRGLIVGCGEIADGSFPSSLLGATDLVFESVHAKSLKRPAKNLPLSISKQPKFKSFFERCSKNIPLRK